MTPENISSILGRESPVYYRDGKEKLGVLFEDIHRQYLKYDQVPETFINAIIAAEDDQFFNHYGIDFFGIARAMIANFKAGRIVQGGSTITQQTAKNLFKRESRSYEAKVKEMLFALRLEYRFSKEHILEFYCNQFYVSGNGHGLGVAARYYFDKEAKDLTLLEAAFIAGSVKQPNYYNPFIKKNEESALKARLRAEKRAEYVLGNMLKLGMISQAEYDSAASENIMFNRGKTRFALNTIMDLVKQGLESE
ncbi:transglycosylase domain-containing protein, partial [Desulfobulbus sp. TB]|nr:transglycosylase domain-containing protein [Desulfobulbus sp. TB]